MTRRRSTTISMSSRMKRPGRTNPNIKPATFVSDVKKALIVLGTISIIIFALYSYLSPPAEQGELFMPVRRRSISSNSLSKAISKHEIENDDGTKYHIVFSTGCSPFQDWQSYVFFFHAWQSGQQGNVTRVASCGNTHDANTVAKLHEETIAIMSDRFHLHITVDYSTRVKPGMTYKFFNKPFGLLDFLENALEYSPSETSNPNDDSIILLLDPDQMIIRPFTNDFSQSFEVWRPTKGKVKLPTKVGHGSPFAQQYGFGIQWKRKVNATYVANGPSRVDTMDMDEAKAFYAVGPPYIATAKDMYSLTRKWTEFAPRVHDLYPHLLAEMFAYCFAAAHLNLPHRVAHSFMVSDVWSGGEGWKLVDKMGKANVCNPPPDLNPHVIHYCQRYMLGKWFIGKYRLRKDFISCDAPLLKEPPNDIVKYNYQLAPDGSQVALRSAQVGVRHAYMICALIPRLNQAAIFYKEHHCDGKGNFEKTYIFHDSDAGMD